MKMNQVFTPNRSYQIGTIIMFWSGPVDTEITIEKGFFRVTKHFFGKTLLEYQESANKIHDKLYSEFKNRRETAYKEKKIFSEKSPEDVMEIFVRSLINDGYLEDMNSLVECIHIGNDYSNVGIWEDTFT